MTKVAILQMPNKDNEIGYYAVSGNKQSFGKTAGEALDSLAPQLNVEGQSTIVIVQSRKPDRFFNVEQKQRLSELMSSWRTARDKGESLLPEELQELEELISVELNASAERTAAILTELGE